MSNKIVIFGHQSVGKNILDGFNIIYSHGEGIIVKSISENDSLGRGSVNHVYLGKNGDPFGKIEEFKKLLSKYVDSAPDIALFKFCYLDIDDRTDIDRLFSFYESTVTELEKKFPQMVIVHTTVPLRQVQTGPKAWIKRIIGKPVTGLSDNVARERFNASIRRVYGQGLLYDIALHESTYPDGRRESFQRDGSTYYALVPQYTDDGDHLNNQGSEVLARQFVRILAQAGKQHDLP